MIPKISMTQNFVQKHQFFYELGYIALIPRSHGLDQIRWKIAAIL